MWFNQATKEAAMRAVRVAPLSIFRQGNWYSARGKWSRDGYWPSCALSVGAAAISGDARAKLERGEFASLDASEVFGLSVAEMDTVCRAFDDAPDVEQARRDALAAMGRLGVRQ